MRSERPPGPPVPSVRSTNSIDGAVRSMASASAAVMFGRMMSSWKLWPEEKLTTDILETYTVFGPSVRKTSRMDSSKPRIIAVMPTIDVMPMTTPSTVRNERSLFPRRVSHDIATISVNRLRRTGSFLPKRFYRIERCCARCGVHPKEQADGGGHPDAEHDGPRLDDGRQRGDATEPPRHRETEERAADAAKRRERDRLGEDLPHDV